MQVYSTLLCHTKVSEVNYTSYGSVVFSVQLLLHKQGLSKKKTVSQIHFNMNCSFSMSRKKLGKRFVLSNKSFKAQIALFLLSFLARVSSCRTGIILANRGTPATTSKSVMKVWLFHIWPRLLLSSNAVQYMRIYTDRPFHFWIAPEDCNKKKWVSFGTVPIARAGS